MPKPGNLIIFLSDNHNRSVMGAYGHPIVSTPNLDRMAGRGARFTNAYSASPLCCPARAAIATGRFPHQTRYWDNAIAYDGRIASWMHRIRGQGHEVVSVGKLHFTSTEQDNGFTHEIEPMHILDGKGPVPMLLRGEGEEPRLEGQWELYRKRSGIGATKYQDYDVRIATQAIEWLREHGSATERPWVLFVSFVSAHPPFEVPERLWNLYAGKDVPLPTHYDPATRPTHAALDYLRHTMCTEDLDDAMLSQVARGYFGLITHLDEQIGRVMDAVEECGLDRSTRMIYTSDHGEMLGAHGLLGKFNMYEGSIGVPLLVSGPGIQSGATIDQITSHVDLFPTIVESVGAHLSSEDADLPGVSLWPALEGHETKRVGFAEYHGTGTRNAVYMVRQGRWKLTEYVNDRPQLFDLSRDPKETQDLSTSVSGAHALQELRTLLKGICDPEATDRLAKADQRAKLAYWGGRESVLRMGSLLFTPPPGAAAEITPRAAGS